MTEREEERAKRKVEWSLLLLMFILNAFTFILNNSTAAIRAFYMIIP